MWRLTQVLVATTSRQPCLRKSAEASNCYSPITVPRFHQKPARYSGSSITSLKAPSSTIPARPWLQLSQCRPQDTVVLCEFAADQHELLTSVMTEVARVHQNLPTIKIHLADGYKALQQKRGVATPERRGLVFVDPPYSYGSDTQRAVALAVRLRVNWRSARFCLWYPATRAHSKVVDSFRGASLGACLAAELFRGGEDGKGTGMLLVQPPFGIEVELRELLNGLARSLRREGEESLEVRVRWVSSEE